MTLVYLPSDSGEKMTLSISILLGQTVFLFLVANRTPETSLAIPMIGAFLLFSMLMVTISVAMNVLICNIHFRSAGTHTITQKLKKIVIQKLAPKLKLRRPGQFPDFTELDEKIQVSSFKHYNIPNFMNSSIDSVNYLYKMTRIDLKRGEEIDEWKYVGMILDRLSLIVYTFVCVAGSVYFWLLVHLQKGYELDTKWKPNGIVGQLTAISYSSIHKKSFLHRMIDLYQRKMFNIGLRKSRLISRLWPPHGRLIAAS